MTASAASLMAAATSSISRRCWAISGETLRPWPSMRLSRTSFSRRTFSASSRWERAMTQIACSALGDRSWRPASAERSPERRSTRRSLTPRRATLRREQNHLRSLPKKRLRKTGQHREVGVKPDALQLGASDDTPRGGARARQGEPPFSRRSARVSAPGSTGGRPANFTVRAVMWCPSRPKVRVGATRIERAWGASPARVQVWCVYRFRHAPTPIFGRELPQLSRRPLSDQSGTARPRWNRHRGGHPHRPPTPRFVKPSYTDTEQEEET